MKDKSPSDIQARKRALDAKAFSSFCKLPPHAVPKSLTWRLAHPHVDHRPIRDQIIKSTANSASVTE